MRKIYYYLRKTYLSTCDENRIVASNKNKETLCLGDLILIMMGKSTIVTRQDIMVVFDLLKESVMGQIIIGYPINTDLYKANVSIKGGFASSDEFDETRHQVNVNLNASAEFKEEVFSVRKQIICLLVLSYFITENNFFPYWF